MLSRALYRIAERAYQFVHGRTLPLVGINYAGNTTCYSAADGSTVYSDRCKERLQRPCGAGNFCIEECAQSCTRCSHETETRDGAHSTFRGVVISSTLCLLFETNDVRKY